MKRQNFIELPLKEQLLKKIRSYISTIWATKVNQNNLDKWLENFNNQNNPLKEEEQLNMLYLLSKFSFLGEKEIRELLISLYRDLYKRPIIEKIRKLNNETISLELIQSEFLKVFFKTKFVSVGGISESSAQLMYAFRQENSITSESLISQNDVFRKAYYNEELIYININHPEIEEYIYIDDFIGTGIQCIDKLKEDILLLKEKNPNLRFRLFALVATEEGILTITQKKLFDSVEAVFILDNTFKAFNRNSRYYINCPKEINKDFAKKTALKYGEFLLPRNELGFGDCQLLLGFNHNTPDNTLPIIWSEERNWNVIFKRFLKK